ncbi:MAG: hypothetical protein AAF206_19175 [Bacteroidota bacterium]
MKYILLSLILILLVKEGQAQDRTRSLAIGYFSQLAMAHGVSAQFSTPIHEWSGQERNHQIMLQSQLAWFGLPNDFQAVLINPGIGLRRQKSARKSWQIWAVSAGYLYQANAIGTAVDLQGNTSVSGREGSHHFFPNLSLTHGHHISTNLSLYGKIGLAARIAGTAADNLSLLFEIGLSRHF